MNPKTASRLSLLAVALLSASLLSPLARAADAHSAHHAAASAPPASAEMTDGEVRKIDREAGKLTLKHADIKSLDMPAMTMVFQVKDPAVLEQVKAGDKVKFEAQKLGGAYTVTSIQKAP